MNKTEKDFFKIITGKNFEEAEVNMGNKQFIQNCTIAQACTRKYEEGLREAWQEGYNDGCSDGQSYAVGHSKKTSNPYLKTPRE